MIQQGINNMLGVAGLAGAYFRSSNIKSGVEKAQNAGAEAKKAVESGASAEQAQSLLNSAKNPYQFSEVASAQDEAQKQLNEAIVANPGSLPENFEGDISDFMTEGEQAAYQAEQIRQRDFWEEQMQAGSPEANPLTIAAEAAISSKDAQIVQNRANKETREQFFERVKSGEFKKQSETSLPIPKTPVSGPAPTLKEATRNIAFSNPVRKAHNNKMSEFLRGE